jgi:hypothetical protein
MADVSLRHAGPRADLFPDSRLAVSPILGRVISHEIFLALQLVSQHPLPWKIHNNLVYRRRKHLAWQLPA